MEKLPCEGDACDAIAIFWDADAEHFWIRNSSSRRVYVVLLTWPTVTEFRLDAGELRAVLAAQFELPVDATFLP